MNTRTNAFTAEIEFNLPTDLFQETGSRLADWTLNLLDTVIIFAEKVERLPMRQVEKDREQAIFNSLLNGETGRYL